MEPELDFSPLLLVSALAFLIPIATHRLTRGTIPSVVSEILAGIIFGQSVVGIIDQNEWLEFLSLFGFAYLMFLSGLEINIALLVRPIGPQWYRPAVPLRQSMLAGGIVLGLTVATTAVGVGLLNGLGPVDDFWMLLFILLATAVGVVVPVLKSRGDAGPYAQSIIVIGFLLEFIAILGVGVVAALEREGLGVEFWLILAIPAVFALLLWAVLSGRARFPDAVALMHELAHASSQIQIRARPDGAGDVRRVVAGGGHGIGVGRVPGGPCVDDPFAQTRLLDAGQAGCDGLRLLRPDLLHHGLRLDRH